MTRVIIGSCDNVERLTDENARLRAALVGLLDRYCDLVNCGDCGYWDPEKEEPVKAARAALSHKEN